MVRLLLFIIIFQNKLNACEEAIQLSLETLEEDLCDNLHLEQTDFCSPKNKKYDNELDNTSSSFSNQGSSCYNDISNIDKEPKEAKNLKYITDDIIKSEEQVELLKSIEEKEGLADKEDKEDEMDYKEENNDAIHQKTVTLIENTQHSIEEKTLKSNSSFVNYDMSTRYGSVSASNEFDISGEDISFRRGGKSKCLKTVRMFNNERLKKILPIPEIEIKRSFSLEIKREKIKVLSEKQISSDGKIQVRVVMNFFLVYEGEYKE